MKLLIVLSALVAITLASDVSILRSESDINPDGSFQYAYETADGVKGEAHGDVASVRGSFSYTSPEGTPIELSYVADENGFQPTGSHIPVAPEVPPQILRALEYIRAHPPKDEHRRK